MPAPSFKDFAFSGGFPRDLSSFPTDINNYLDAVDEYNHPTTAQGVLGFLGDRQADDESSRDLYFDYLLSEKSANDAYQRELLADSTKYQRLVKDLKNAGLNPMFALGGASSGNINSSANSYSSAYETSRYHKASEELGYANLKEQKRKNNMDFVASLIRSVVTAAAIAI